MKMKKMLIGAFLGMFALAGITVLPNYASAQTTTDRSKPASDTNIINGNQKLKGAKLLDTIKTTINRCLGILATVALAICLYGGFMMVISAGSDDKYKTGLKVLKNAAIGLAIIGLSWIIVSFVFWAIGTMSGGNNTQGAQTNVTSNDGIIVTTNQ